MKTGALEEARPNVHKYAKNRMAVEGNDETNTEGAQLERGCSNNLGTGTGQNNGRSVRDVREKVDRVKNESSAGEQVPADNLAFSLRVQDLDAKIS